MAVPKASPIHSWISPRTHYAPAHSPFRGTSLTLECPAHLTSPALSNHYRRSHAIRHVLAQRSAPTAAPSPAQSGNLGSVVSAAQTALRRQRLARCHLAREHERLQIEQENFLGSA